MRIPTPQAIPVPNPQPSSPETSLSLAQDMNPDGVLFDSMRTMVQAYNEIPPLTVGVANALAFNSDKKLASASVVKNAVTKGWTPMQTIENLGKGQIELQNQMGQVIDRMNNTQVPQVDLSRVNAAQEQVQTLLGQQPQAPTQQMPELQDWQKAVAIVAALFGGQNAGAVFQGLQQGTLQRNQMENQNAQANFENQFNQWRNQLQGAQTNLSTEADIAGIQQRNAQNVMDTQLGIDKATLDTLRQMYGDNNDLIAAAIRDITSNRRIDAQMATGLARAATSAQGAILRAIKDAPPEARGTLYAQLRATAQPGTAFADLTDAEIDMIAGATTLGDANVQKTQAQTAESKARVKALATRMKVDEARAAQIVEATKWIRPDMQSRIQDRIARIEVARRNSQLAAQRLQLANDKFAQGATPKTAKGANDANKSVINALKEEAKNLEELRKSYKFVMDNEVSTDSPAYEKAQASAAAMTAEIQKIRERITNANKAVYDAQNATIPPFEVDPNSIGGLANVGAFISSGGLSGAIGAKPATNVPRNPTPKPKPKPNTSKGKTQKTKSGTEFVIE